jgi:hypothetical protein
MSDPGRRLSVVEDPVPPGWREFIRFCRELRHGEIERLSIQDGVPVLAEITRKKVRFTRDAQRRDV